MLDGDHPGETGGIDFVRRLMRREKIGSNRQCQESAFHGSNSESNFKPCTATGRKFSVPNLFTTTSHRYSLWSNTTLTCS